MKIQTKNLTGAALDYAVAKCAGATKLWHDTVATWWVELNGEPLALSSGWSARQSWSPSTVWGQGGPIIEKERISVIRDADETEESWLGVSYTSEHNEFGPTPLVAAMRCFVSSRLGEEVDIPDELA